MSDAPRNTVAVMAEDVWISFLIRYHRTDVTLRETFVRMAERLVPNGRGSSHWQREFWALRGVSITANPGEVIGIIGRNGSGKTTLLKALAGIVGPDRGRVRIEGTVGCLMSFGVGFRANLTGRENVFLNGSILGMSQKEIARRMKDIAEFSELGAFLDAPVRTYSTGMRGRLGFSIAAHIDPDVLVLDEVLSAGDMAFQRKAGTVLDRLRGHDKIVVLASHDMDFVKRTCTRVLWLEEGAIRAFGDPSEVTEQYTAFGRTLPAAPTP